MKFALALAIAVQFWTHRGVHVPCHPTAISGYMADRVLLPVGRSGYPADMGTDVSACKIYISTIASTFRKDTEMRATYCMEVAHEVGHLAGLQHDHDPKSVMYGDGGVFDEYAPWYCRHPKAFRRTFLRPGVPLS